MRSYQQIESELRRFREALPVPSDGVSWQVHAFLKYIHDDPFDPKLSVKVLKARCRISDNNISCRFKHEVGMTIKRYIERLRFEAALWLLRQGTWSVAQVALSVGYRHLQTFYRAFQREFACPPGQLSRMSAVGLCRPPRALSGGSEP